MVIVGFGSEVPRLIDELKVLVLNWEANAGHWEPSNRCYWQVNNYWLLCFACYGACQGCNSESEGENEELSHEHPGLNTYRPTRPLNARPAKCWHDRRSAGLPVQRPVPESAVSGLFSATLAFRRLESYSRSPAPVARASARHFRVRFERFQRRAAPFPSHSPSLTSKPPRPRGNATRPGHHF